MRLLLSSSGRAISHRDVAVFDMALTGGSEGWGQAQLYRIQGQEESQEAWSEDEIQAKLRRRCLGDGSG